MIETTNTIYFDFIGKRMIPFFLFIILLITGLIAYFNTGFILGTDFAGGVRIEFSAPSSVEEIRQLINNDQISITTLSSIDGSQNFLLTAPAEFGQEGSGNYLLQPIQQKYTEENIVVLSSDFVKASVGSDFVTQALRLLSILIGLILIYIAFRFDFIYGVGAIFALLHDMSVLLIFTLLFKIPIDLTILASFLTILGYSINDTIVIFDRVRENHTLLPNEDFAKVMNKSIYQTLKRTVLTSVTTLFVAGSIYLWAGNSLQNFGLLLILGIISGTYSSIFVASPITYILWKYKNTIKK